jgi:hypothetical protein
MVEKDIVWSRELSSVGWTLYYICRRPGFEPRSSHLSTIRLEFIVIRLLDQKRKKYCLLQKSDKKIILVV